MSVEIDTRDRVIRMETELKSLKEEFESVKSKVDEIHGLLTEARGASKAIKLLIGLSGTSVFLWVATYWKALVGLVRGFAQ